jgi:hypothetical protein
MELVVAIAFFDEIRRFPYAMLRYEEAERACPTGRDARVLCVARQFRRLVVHRLRAFASRCRDRDLRIDILRCEGDERRTTNPDEIELVRCATALATFDLRGDGSIDTFRALYSIFESNDEHDDPDTEIRRLVDEDMTAAEAKRRRDAAIVAAPPRPITRRLRRR